MDYWFEWNLCVWLRAVLQISPISTSEYFIAAAARCACRLNCCQYPNNRTFALPLRWRVCSTASYSRLCVHVNNLWAERLWISRFSRRLFTKQGDTVQVVSWRFALFSYPFMKVDQRPQNAFHFSWVLISHLAMYLRVWVYSAHTYTQTDTASNDVFITVGMQDRSMLHGDSLISKRQHNLSYNDPKNMNDWIFGRTPCFTKRKKIFCFQLLRCLILSILKKGKGRPLTICFYFTKGRWVRRGGSEVLDTKLFSKPASLSLLCLSPTLSVRRPFPTAESTGGERFPVPYGYGTSAPPGLDPNKVALL